MTRNIETVPTAEIEPMLDLLAGAGMNNSDICEAIGYSTSLISDAQREGKVRLSIKYALMGLIAERKGDLADVLPEIPALVFSFTELTALLMVMTDLHGNGHPGSMQIGRLMVRVADEISRQVREQVADHA